MIVSLSCTGNTLWAARRAAEMLGEPLVDITRCDPSAAPLRLAKGERLGFCFPVHGWRPPLLFRQWLHSAHFMFEETPYVWALCTAGDNIGETMRLLAADLQPHELELRAAGSLIMPESYVGLPFMDVDPPERERMKKETAAQRLEQFLIYIKRYERAWMLTEGQWPRLNTRLLGGFFLRHLITDKPFRVSAEACLRCGKCAQVCPVHNIEFKSGELPEWRHTDRCLACFACYHHCPARAIEYGRRTRGKGQYFYEKTKG